MLHASHMTLWTFHLTRTHIRTQSPVSMCLLYRYHSNAFYGGVTFPVPLGNLVLLFDMWKNKLEPDKLVICDITSVGDLMKFFNRKKNATIFHF